MIGNAGQGFGRYRLRDGGGIQRRVHGAFSGATPTCQRMREGGWKMMVLREVIGDELRNRRLGQGRTLRDVAAAACVSLGYLSEVERGQKEASSELLAAICRALDLQLSEMFKSVSYHLADCEDQT